MGYIIHNYSITESKLRNPVLDLQQAYTVMVECKFFTLDTMNILFKMLGIQIVANKLITHLLEEGRLIKHQGIYDIYYIVTKEFISKTIHEIS